MRYFAASPEAYESARASLNAAFGFPTPGTETAIPPASMLPVSQDGRVCVPVEDRLVELTPAASIVESLLAIRAVDEIDEQSFVSVCAAYYAHQEGSV